MIDDKPLAEAVASARLALDEMVKGGDRKDLPELAEYVSRMQSQLEAQGTNSTLYGEYQGLKATIAVLNAAHDEEGKPLPLPLPAPATATAPEQPKESTKKVEAWKAPPPAPVFDAQGKQVPVPPKAPVVPAKPETPKTPSTPK